MGEPAIALGRTAIVLALLLATAACARPIGDFGRAEPGVLNDQVLPAIGTWRARGSGEPVSKFNFTDEETGMRDRVWRYLVAPHAADWFYDTAAELQRTRLVPAGQFHFKTDRYYDWLKGERFASSPVRYTRLSDDVGADIATMPGVFAAICAVLEVDRQRDIAGRQISGLEADIDADVRARRAENDVVIDAFVRAVGYRYDSYQYALDHLLVETPHAEALKTDALLSDLAVYVEAAERGDFCSGSDLGAGARDAAALPSRVLSGEPHYRK